MTLHPALMTGHAPVRPAGQPLSTSEVAQAQELTDRLLQALAGILPDQPRLPRLLLTALLARGHALLEGAPGQGKTELVGALAGLLGLRFRRIPLTPDLQPADLCGSSVVSRQPGARRHLFHQGPIFANVVLAAGITRAAPKTQAVLLEAMRDPHVTDCGETHALPFPFFVIATHNPHDTATASPLLPAQRDRFLMRLTMVEPSTAALQRIIRFRSDDGHAGPDPLLSSTDLTQLFDLTDAVEIPDPLAAGMARIINGTHPEQSEATEPVRAFVRTGVSLRGALGLAAAARAAALMSGRAEVTPADLHEVAHPVLDHRLVLNPAAVADGITPSLLIDGLLERP